MLSSISNLGQENQNDKNLEEAFEPIVNNIIEKSQKIL